MSCLRGAWAVEFGADGLERALPGPVEVSWGWSGVTPEDALLVQWRLEAGRVLTDQRHHVVNEVASTPSRTRLTGGCSTPTPATSSASTCARPGAGIASRTATRPARTPPKTIALLAAAKPAGPAISAICNHIHRHDRAAGVRRILGVLALARKHGPAVAEGAATATLELGVSTYRFLRRYLDRRPVAPLSLRQVDPLMRQLTLHRDLIDRRTGVPS